jgi:hypothetical protein
MAARLILSYRREVDETRALLGYYAASSRNSLTFGTGILHLHFSTPCM